MTKKKMASNAEIESRYVWRMKDAKNFNKTTRDRNLAAVHAAREILIELGYDKVAEKFCEAINFDSD